jgi:hypothetical protein
METLQIEKANAVKAYNSATKLQKQLLENIFGTETFKAKKTGKITDRVKTFEDALAELGKSYDEFVTACGGLSDDEVAYKKLKIIRLALNEGWKPNWNDSSEYKYYPWFDMRTEGGFDFSYSSYDSWTSDATAGSRLCFKSSDLAKYAGTQFLDIYKDFMTE